MNLRATTESCRAWIGHALGFFYPDACQICGERRATRDEGYVCSDCWQRPDGVRFIKPPFCDTCGLPCEGDITHEFDCSNCREMEPAFCARPGGGCGARPRSGRHSSLQVSARALWFEAFLADLLIRAAKPDLAASPADLIIPVPLHPLKHREREFNQADRLADALGAATGIPVEKRIVKRVLPTQTQTLLSREKRARNMRDAFAVENAAPLMGKRVALIDDVLTTGATTSACARALRKAGAKEVVVWTVARGI